METSQPNVVFYVSDSLRADRLSCYGYDRETTPEIDRLAADGIRFDRAFAQAFKTVESSVSILTGLYPPAHGAFTTRHPVPEGAPRIAERLRDCGYTTGAFSSLVQISRRRRFDAGFDTFEELFWENADGDSPTDWAKRCTDRTVGWLEEVSEPFFAFVWSNGTHSPYQPRAGRFSGDGGSTDVDGSLESLRRAEADEAARVGTLYDDTVHHADGQFGRLLDWLERTGRYEDTLIVLTADHGELLSEHGRMEHARGLPERALRGLFPGTVDAKTLFEPGAHVGHLGVLPYEELIHVPVIVKMPGNRKAGQHRDQMVETVDLMPTVAAVVGAGFDTQGTSLDAVIEDDEPGKSYVYSDTAVSRGIINFRSVRSGTHKFISTDWEFSRLRDWRALSRQNLLLSVLHKAVCGSEVLFEVPEEEGNLRREHPDIAASLRAQYRQWLQRCGGDTAGTEATGLGRETRTQLEDLGYLE